jgi:hypothetical protein
MRLAHGGAVLLLVAVLAGCGGSTDVERRREAVNTYFEQLNRAQEPVLARSAEINEALGRFSLAKLEPARLKALERAQEAIQRALRRVRAVDPPPDAVKLHGDLIRLLALQESIVGELAWATRYVPQNREILRPLAGAGKTLTGALSRAKSSGALVAAFDGYRTSLSAILARLDRLRAPPLLRPGLAAERQTLSRSISLCREIRAALAKRDVDRANDRIAALLAVSRQTGSLGTQKAEIAAARGYNAKVTQIGRLAARVARDRQAITLKLT